MASSKTWKTSLEFGGKVDNSPAPSANRVSKMLNGIQQKAAKTQAALLAAGRSTDESFQLLGPHNGHAGQSQDP